jgi:hypothetical protein
MRHCPTARITRVALKGNITLAVVNDAPVEFAMKLSWAATVPRARFFRYRCGEPQYDRVDVKVNPEPEFSPAPGRGWSDTLPPNSLTLYSTYELTHDDPGILVDDPGAPTEATLI